MTVARLLLDPSHVIIGVDFAGRSPFCFTHAGEPYVIYQNRSDDTSERVMELIGEGEVDQTDFIELNLLVDVIRRSDVPEGFVIR